MSAIHFQDKWKAFFVLERKLKAKSGKKKKITSADSFSVELSGSSMLELAEKQSSSHDCVSAKLPGSQRSQISVARRQLQLNVIVEGFTDC